MSVASLVFSVQWNDFLNFPLSPPAVMQSLARKNEWPLDKMNLTVDVTKKFKEEFNQPAREGVYVYGLYMEGIHSSPLLMNTYILVHLSSPFPSFSPRCKMGHSGWGDRGGSSEGVNPLHARHLSPSSTERQTGDA